MGYQEQNAPIPSMQTSVCRQLVLFSTIITLLIVLRGENETEKIKQKTKGGKKDQISQFWTHNMFMPAFSVCLYQGKDVGTLAASLSPGT